MSNVVANSKSPPLESPALAAPYHQVYQSICNEFERLALYEKRSPHRLVLPLGMLAKDMVKIAAQM